MLTYMNAIAAALDDDDVVQRTLLLSIVEALIDKAAFELTLATATTTQTTPYQSKVHYESILLRVHQQSLSSRIYDLQNDDWKILLWDGTALVDNFCNNGTKLNKIRVQGVESARDMSNGETDKAAVPAVVDKHIVAFVQSRVDNFKRPHLIIPWLVYHDISTTDQFMQLVQQFAFRKKVKWFGYGRLCHAANLWYGSLTVPAKAVLGFIQARAVQGDFWFPRRLVHTLLTHQSQLLSPAVFHAAVGRRCWMRTSVKPHRFPIFRRALADWYKTLKNHDEANHISPVDSTENKTDKWDGDEAPINDNRRNDAATTATSDEVVPFDETQDSANTTIPTNTTTTISNDSALTTIPEDVGPTTQDVGFVIPYLTNSQRPTSPETSKTVTTDDDDSPASSSSARHSTSTIATEEEQEEAAAKLSTPHVTSETIDSNSQPSTRHYSHVNGYSNFYPNIFYEQDEKQEEGSGVPEVQQRTWFISDLDPKGKQKIEAIVVDPTPPPLTATTKTTATNGSQASGSSCSWVKASDYSPSNDKKQDNDDDDDDSSLNHHGFTWENPAPAPTRNTNDTDNDEDESGGTVWV